MAAGDFIAKARALLANAATLGVFEALEQAAEGDDYSDALNLLDRMTPGDFTFLMWADGAKVVVYGGQECFEYSYDRPRAQILALLGRASLRLTRGSGGGEARHG